MKKMVSMLAAAALAGTALVPVAMAKPSSARPNIVVILVDDMGYSDLGAFGGEIRTPNLDKLANDGVKLTNFHATPVCSPTRAELLTGVDHHQTGIGNFPELMQPNQKGHPGYEGYLNDRVVTIAEVLKDAGYKTIHSGKWHLGYDPRANPAARGFERSFTMLGGGHNHFGVPSAYQVSMPNAGTVYTEDGVTVSLPEKFYSSDNFTDKLIGYLPDGKKDKRPFFAYLAYTAPHYPLHAPAEDIARYKGRYDAGYEVLRQQRLARQKALGLIAAGVEPHDFTAPVPWVSLTAEQKALEARKMEVYAAMVDRLDQNVGKLVNELKQRGMYDNTLFVFLSDNGAEGHELDKSVIAADTGKRMLTTADNSLDSIGTARSYIWYGPNWAEAATAPSRLYKSFPTEGGTRVVAFLSDPGGVRQGVSKSYFSVRDIVPTLAEYAGAALPGASYKGRPVIAVQGRSMLPVLGVDGKDPADQSVAANGEMFGRRYARNGAWKAVHIPPPTGPGRWELFNIVADPGEVHDMAAMHPEILQQLTAQWDDYARDKGVVMPAIPGN